MASYNHNIFGEGKTIQIIHIDLNKNQVTVSTALKLEGCCRKSIFDTYLTKNFIRFDIHYFVKTNKIKVKNFKVFVKNEILDMLQCDIFFCTFHSSSKYCVLSDES